MTVATYVVHNREYLPRPCTSAADNTIALASTLPRVSHLCSIDQGSSHTAIHTCMTRTETHTHAHMHTKSTGEQYTETKPRNLQMSSLLALPRSGPHPSAYSLHICSGDGTNSVQLAIADYSVLHVSIIIKQSLKHSSFGCICYGHVYDPAESVWAYPNHSSHKALCCSCHFPHLAKWWSS